MKWNQIFEYISIELQIQKYQNEYYKKIDECNNIGNLNFFIEFMLEIINQTI